MSDKIYDIPPEWKKRAFVDEAKYKEMYARSIKDPNGFWAEQAKRLDWYRTPTKIKNASFGPDNVSIKWFEDGSLNVAYNCIDRHLAERGEQTAIIWEGDDPSQSDEHITYRELHDEVCKFANILRKPRRQEGRPRHHLHADDPRGGRRHARLRAHRRGAFGGVRRLLAGVARRPHRGLRQSNVVITADEGLRGGSKIPLKANVDAAIAKVGGVDHVIVVRRTGATVDMDPGRDVYYDKAAEVVTAECPCEQMNAEDPLFILYTSGSTGKPKGVLHTTGGYLVCTRDDPPIRVRLSRRRYLLVHRRRRLGHRPQLHRLRPARQRRDHADVRGRAELPDHVALLGGDRQAQGQHLLHRADRDPRADAGRRRAGEEDLAHVAAPARHRRRADQSGGVGVVLPRGRRRPLPDRRHLVADRDRRHHDHAAARRDPPQAGLGDAAVLRRRAADRRRRRQGARGRGDGNLCIAEFLAGADAHGLRRPRALRRHLLQDLSRQVLHRRRLPPRRRRLLLDHRPRRRRDQRLRPPHRHRRGRERAGGAPRWRRPRWSAIRTTSRARASTPMSP